MIGFNGYPLLSSLRIMDYPNRRSVLWSLRLVLPTVPGPGPNRTFAKLAVWVVNKPELHIRVWFHGELRIHLNWAGCQRGHLQIHIKLLYLQRVSSILSKSSFQQPIMSFCLLSSLQYRLIWYLCFTFDIWYICLARRSIIQLCTRKSVRCLDYEICKS
jgi:hypothetical protein